MVQENQNYAEVINENQLDSEVVELEFDDESVEYYIVDQDDNEIGVCLNEDGQLVEYLYEDEEPSASDYIKEAVQSQVNEAAVSIKNMRDELYNSKDDAAEAVKELKAASDELQGMLNEVKDSFKIFPSKKK